MAKRKSTTSPHDFVELMNAAGFYQQKDLAAALGVTPTRVGWFLNGKVRIPLYITLAMAELVRRHKALTRPPPPQPSTPFRKG